MRYGSLGSIIVGALIGAWPMVAHADYMGNARADLKQGNLKAAQIELRNAVRGDPQNAEAHYWLGRVNFELGDIVASQREAMAARDRGYDPHQIVPLLSQALLAQNKFDELLDTLKPEGKDPTLDAAILVSRGYAEIGLKREIDAKKSFAEAEEVAPNAVEPLLADARLAVARADLTTAQQKIDRAVEAQPKSTEALLAKAQLMRLKNDIPSAIIVLDQLIADQPSVVQARLDRANLELASGKKDAAQADLDVVLKGSPGNVHGLYLRAVMEAQARNYQAADLDLDHISTYLPRIARGFYLQAMVKEQLGQLEQAEDSARKFLNRSPNDLMAYKLLARIEFAKRRPDLMITTLEKVAEAGKADAETYDLLGRAYSATARSSDAVQAFQKAQNLAPNDIGVQSRLATVRLNMGDVDAAVVDLEHTLSLAPKLPVIGEALFFAALATGDTVKTGDALEKIRAAQGETEVVQNLEGLYKLALIDFDGAKAIFEGIIAKNPDFNPAKINLARVAGMTADFATAENILKQILDKQPASQPALTMLSSNYVLINKLSDAITLLEKAHQVEPTQSRITVSLGEAYIRANQPQKALDLALVEKGENTSANNIVNLRAAAYLALGQRKDARAAYEQILKQDPSSNVAMRQLTALLVEAGDFESARNVFTSAIAAEPHDYQHYLDLVAVDLKSTGLDAALATADRLASQDREFVDLLALRGDAYLLANRPLDAITAFTEVSKTNVSSFLTGRLASAQLRSNRKDDANQTLVDWLAKHPDDMVATQLASETELSLGRFDEAEKFLSALLERRPHDAVALNNLAWIYQQAGRHDEARPLARQAYILSPGAQTADTLGWIQETTGEMQGALALLRQANAEAPNDPRIAYHYAVALKDTGDLVTAKKLLEAVSAVTAEFTEKAEAKKLLEGMTKKS